MLERPLRRLERQMRGELPLGRDVTLADAGALLDPLVGGLDGPGKFFVGDHALRQVRATALDD